MELNVGHAINEKYAINIDLYFTLKSIIEGENNFDSASIDDDLIYDTRIIKSDWKPILQKELMHLFQWATKRIIYSNNAQIIPTNSAYIFLPYYGITLHFIRRVMPLLLLNFDVSIIISDKDIQSTKKVINRLVEIFRIQGQSILSKDEFGEIDEKEEQLMLFTGHKSNLNLLQKKYKKSKIIGATGACAVSIYKDNKSFDFELKSITPSCTSVGYKFLSVDDVLIDEHNEEFAFDIIYQINPTIIYTDYNIEQFSDFKIINIGDEHQDLVGMCADALYGYCGDYRL